MCGIAGYLNLSKEPASQEIVKRMTETLAHRGPDGRGLYVDGPAALGHRRLAIIDITDAGRQPMATEDGRYVITYNGELYNFRELRTQLQAKGWQFHSHSDTEVVLYAMAAWGMEALLKFNGMFAFALWDTREKTLFLARDRFGVKPLYYSLKDDVFLFGSEVKALLEHPALTARMDSEALVEYMTFQNFFTKRTLFQNVQLLPAASFLKISPDSKKETGIYWDYNFEEPEKDLGKDYYEEQIDHLFRQAVNRQLVSDVPVSAYLSGGMDSGSIAAIAAKQIDPLRTFTVGFDMNSASGLELGFDEREKAEFMSYKFQTEHYEMVLKAGDMERALKRMVWYLEEPRVGQSYPNFYAAQLASKFSKVVLAGTGGDELFGGYPWRYYRAAVNLDYENYIDKYYSYWQRLISNKNIHEVFAEEYLKHVWTQDIFEGVLKGHVNKIEKPEDYINHSLYFEAKTFLHGLLVVEDKLSMAHGLETRVPFLDNDLVDCAMSVPVHYKLGNLGEIVRLNENEPGSKTHKYLEKTNDGKLILRDVMKHYIPDEISKAVKQGFSAPDNSWFKGESIEWVRESLLNKNAVIYDFMECEPLQRMVNEHLEGKQNRRLLIWSLLYLEQWCRTFGISR